MSKIRCVSFSRGEYLIYNSSLALLTSDFRTTANAGAHLLEYRPLFEEEIESLLDRVKLDDIVERDLNEEEAEIVDNIKLYYPAVKYIVKGEGDKAFEKIDRDIQKMMSGESTAWDKFKGLFKSDKKAVNFFKINKKAMDTMRKELERDEELVAWLSANIENEQLTAQTVEVFTELISREPSWMKLIDIPKTSRNMEIDDIYEKFEDQYSKNPSLMTTLKELPEDALGGLDHKANSYHIVDEIEKYLFSKQNLPKPLRVKEIKGLEIKVEPTKSKEGDRIVAISAPLGSLAAIIQILNINPEDVTGDLY